LCTYVVSIANYTAVAVANVVSIAFKITKHFRRVREVVGKKCHSVHSNELLSVSSSLGWENSCIWKLRRRPQRSTPAGISVTGKPGPLHLSIL
jgi:hypothetical protein